MNGLNPYIGSALVEKVRSSRVVNVFDIDGTLAMGGTPTEVELLARKESRRHASKLGASVFISARTPELIMTNGEYYRSIYMGHFDRMPARVGTHRALGDMKFEVALERLPEFGSVTGADAIASMGVGILIAQGGGYMLDREYETTALGKFVGNKWRQRVIKQISDVNNDELNDIVGALAPIEFGKCYELGEVDVTPLPYRVQLDWTGKGAARMKCRVKRRLERVFERRPALNVRFVDESNPTRGRYTLYLLHAAMRKERMLERILSSILVHTHMRPSDITLNIFGDTFTDLRQLYAGGTNFGKRHGGTVKMNFVLVGGSRLSDPISRGARTFGGEDLTWLYGLLEKTDMPGVCNVNIPSAPPGTRRFFLCDDMFPDMPGPQSIQRFFEEGYAVRP